MGSHLSEPETGKQTEEISNEHYVVASSSMQGWRLGMEDAHCHILSYGNDDSCAFLGVFDGHGGPLVADFTSRNLPATIAASQAFKNGDVSLAIKEGCLHTDVEVRNSGVHAETSGTTAIFTILKDKHIFCGNVGDSRAVASVCGRVEELSFDHKPTRETELRRISAAGGYVELNRVNGSLALSRALGDFAFKKNPSKSPEEQIITASPEVIVKEITDEHEFVVLGCDGIWDVLTNVEAVEFVRSRISQNMELCQICEELLTRCLAPDSRLGSIGCDNMTVVIVAFLHGRSYENLAKKCQLSSRI
ncbi:probable protein phosphatase 2C T23F11.1 [Oscarella lobularis]|uniref:probable protein phosphatase 2C T23F11.1 n=1 Tax=Oscarella lobularis TaxID=121494 RepID=UPI00331373CE